MVGRRGRTARAVRMGVALAAAALTFAVGTGPIGGAGAEPSLPWWCAPGATLDAATLPSVLPAVEGCDLAGRVVTFGTASVVVPERGMGVRADGIGPDGSRSLVVENAAASTIVEELVSTVKNLLFPETPDPCSPAVASAYSRAGWKAYGTITWTYNPLNEPTSAAGWASTAIATGATSMADGHNDCGITTVPRSSFHAYAGATTRTPAINAAGGCGANDNNSVVGWGTVNPPYIAWTCTWYQLTGSPYTWVASDMRYASNVAWGKEYIVCIGGVNDSIDLESVAAHEWGHAFGLGHVAESGATSSQTMSESIDDCDTTARSLGRGDLNGMIAIYGAL